MDRNPIWARLGTAISCAVHVGIRKTQKHESHTEMARRGMAAVSTLAGRTTFQRALGTGAPGQMLLPFCYPTRRAVLRHDHEQARDVRWGWRPFRGSGASTVRDFEPGADRGDWALASRLSCEAADDQRADWNKTVQIGVVLDFSVRNSNIVLGSKIRGTGKPCRRWWRSQSWSRKSLTSTRTWRRRT